MRSKVTWIAFDEDNELDLEDDWTLLSSIRPRQYSLVVVAAAVSWEFFGKPLVITSIHREGDNGVHGVWRGTDCRIYHPDRPVAPGKWGLDEEEAQELASLINKTYEYVRSDGTPSQCAIIHGTGLLRHLHLQTPVGEQWQS